MSGVVMQWYRRAPTRPQGTATSVVSSTWSKVPPFFFHLTVRIHTAKMIPVRMQIAYMWIVTGPMENLENPGEGIYARFMQCLVCLDRCYRHLPYPMAGGCTVKAARRRGVCQRDSLWMPSDSASTLAARSRSPSFGAFAVTLSSSSRVCTRAEPTMTPSA